MAFYQKYRSQKFADLIGQDHVRDTLLFAVKSGKVSHAYLLTGPRGTGKTSTARLLAKAINCLTTKEKLEKGEEVTGEPCNTCSSCKEITEGRAVDIVEIDAASHTGVDDVRELIDKAQYAPVKAKNKIYIIDEVHMLSKSAFNALLKTLEEPPKHLVFILATTEAYKLPSTILSRVQRYDFRRVSKDDIISNLKKIAKSEKIQIGDDALELIALSAQGGHRDAIVVLEKMSSLGKEITLADVENILGVADKKFVFQFLGAIFNASSEEGLKIAHRLYEDGIDMVQFNKDVLEGLRKVLLFKESGKALFEDSAENIEEVKNLSSKIGAEKLIKLIETFIQSGNLLKDIAYPVLPIEMAVVEACDTGQNQELRIGNQEITRKVERSVQNSNIVTSNGLSCRAKAGVEKSSDKRFLDSARDDKGEARDDKTSKSQDGKKETVKAAEEKNSHPEPTKSSIRDSATSEKILKSPPPAGSRQDAGQVPHGNRESLTETISVYQMTDDIWEKLIAGAKRENNSLAALLRDAKPLEYSDTKLVLGVKFKFHKDKISLPAHLQILEKVFSDITGNKCVISCRLMDEKSKKVEPISGAELQKAAEEIFA